MAKTESPTRRFTLVHMSAGDYLLSSNDRRTLWRIYTYDEDGSLEGVKGRFWAAARRPMPKPDEIVDLEEWDEWEHYAAPLKTRLEAISYALRADA